MEQNMNEQKLIQNVIEQIKEAQLKLGAEKEVIRLYFPMASMNAILGTNYTDEQEMLTALRTNTVFDTTVLGRLKFFIHEGRFEVRVPFRQGSPHRYGCTYAPADRKRQHHRT